MATLMGVSSPLGPSKSDISPSQQDPFISQTTNSNHHRFSHFDNHLFALSPKTSPDQAKRALEAHLAETERRIQDASKLGTALLQQRKEMEERLGEIERQQQEESITPELRQKLMEIEKEYNEVGRESARAFLPKTRVLNNHLVGPYIGSNFNDKRSTSPSKENFESQGTGSPSKLNIINRRQRNQPINRVHDIEFATEISTSLLSQVRHLQALLVEKEDYIKTIASENSRLEVEIEGFTERLRSLDESGERYKDENWNLEAQIQEFKAKEKAAADRERRLTQNLNIIKAEKSAAQKDLDEIKSSHAKLLVDHIAALKHSDADLGNAKRNLNEVESERNTLQRKVEELLSQNHELVKAIAHHKGRLENKNEKGGLAVEDLEIVSDDLTPEHSPPPSPVKGTPRHSLLESETLKSSLQHAHRMIQNLKSNIHREKTEKLELKRLLQDARDELELRRGEIGQSNSKKTRRLEQKEPKKQLKLGQLGAMRNTTHEVFLEESNWEEDKNEEKNDPLPTPGISPGTLQNKHLVTTCGPAEPQAPTSAGTSDQFETANELEVSDAFVTADESSIQKDDFQFSQDGLSEDLTETEGGQHDLTWPRSNRTTLLTSSNRDSFQSTASTSDDEYGNSYEERKALSITQPSRLRLKVNRSGNRRSRVPSEEPRFYGSPASLANTSRDGTPQATGQSLFAELGEIVGCDEEDDSTDEIAIPFKNTPRSMLSSSSIIASNMRPTPSSAVSKPTMIDSGVMTEPWELDLPINRIYTPNTYNNEPNSTIIAKSMSELHSGQVSVATQINSLVKMTDASCQWSKSKLVKMTDASCQCSENKLVKMIDASCQWSENKLQEQEEMKSRSIYVSTYSEMSSEYDLDRGILSTRPAKFSTPPKSLPCSSITRSGSTSKSEILHFSVSRILSEEFYPYDLANLDTPTPEKLAQESLSAAPNSFVLSTIQSLEIEPFEPLSYEANMTPISSEKSNKGEFQKFEPLSSERCRSRLAMTDKASQVLGLGSKILKSSDDSDKANQILGLESKLHKSTDNPDRTSQILGLESKLLKSRDDSDKAKQILGLESKNFKSAVDSHVIKSSDSQPLIHRVAESNTSDFPLKRSLKIDESCQTMLTANEIESMLDYTNRATPDESRWNSSLPSRQSQSLIKRNLPLHETLRSTDRTKVVADMRAHESAHFSISRSISNDTYTHELKSNGRPLSVNEQNQNIPTTAKDTNLSPCIVGSMGPPPLPQINAQSQNSLSRPITPNVHVPLSPSLKDGTTPRPTQSYGSVMIHTPTRNMRSRVSSISSFASEIDNRFQLHNGIGVSSGIQTGTDPRMISAITQTMIGEYLWKYTRKTGRGVMSEKRHRRYFWVHPYTRTLYWSNRDPSLAGRSELRAKSVPIEAVKVVTDDNPMPPGLHRKSLIIVTPNRAVKFTATTGQRHETWFNSLSYLLLRNEEESIEDTSGTVNESITCEDVAEFNPSCNNNHRARMTAVPSDHNYTNRNEFYGKNNLNTGSKSSRLSVGNFSRLSSFWKPNREGILGSISSRQSKYSIDNIKSVYEASEVHDSAEDLREIIEKQDRESDKLENVRACCDGRHDVGHLHNSNRG